MIKRMHGEPLGCTDTAPSERFSDEMMSRFLDIIDACKNLPKPDDEYMRNAVLAAIPAEFKFDMTWSCWKYVAVQ